MSNMNDEHRSNVEVVMRQTECYDISLIKRKLQEHDNNVVDVICDLMTLPTAPAPPPLSSSQSHFEDIRSIMDEKDRLFQQAMARNKK
jgi:hypothetical protein